MRKVCTNVFKFDELNDAGKARAAQWYREFPQDQWWDAVYEDAANIADILGINIRTLVTKYRNGAPHYGGINIGFTGFSCQGDGAHFQGKYRYAEGAAVQIREYAPQDAELHRIADELQKLQSLHQFKLTAEVKHSGRYSHEYCTDIDVMIQDDVEDLYPDIETAKELVEILRRFMRWIYRTLESENDHLQSDETIFTFLSDSNYEFTASGRRHIVIG